MAEKGNGHQRAADMLQTLRLSLDSLELEFVLQFPESRWCPSAKPCGGAQLSLYFNLVSNVGSVFSLQSNHCSCTGGIENVSLHSTVTAIH